MNIIQFLKNWTLPSAIVVGTVSYLVFRYVPALDYAGDKLGAFFDVFFPITLFFTLFVTFCKVDFKQMKFTRWHIGVLLAQGALVLLNMAIIYWVQADWEQKMVWEAVLTCVIGPSATAAPVVVSKLGGNINTMTTFTLISSLVSALAIPLAFPLLEQVVHVSFFSAFFIILQKIFLVLILPLLLAWVVRHTLPRFHQAVLSCPDLGFYCWSVSLSITTGITVKNIFHSEASMGLLLLIALLSLVVCFLQFGVGRLIGHFTGDVINAGQALFQKNTALSIWVAYMYLNPVASIGAGCYVLWQNIINSLELWQDRRKIAKFVK